MPQIKIAVIGAGMAGLKAASTLHQVGMEVTVFEKSRGLGGRLASRRTDFGHFNHGAQYVTARNPGFDAYLQQATEHKSARNWRPNLHRGAPENGIITPARDNAAPQTQLEQTAHTSTEGNLAIDHWFQGAPQMNKLIHPLLASFDIKKQHRITEIEPSGPRHFMLHDDLEGTFGPFDGVIVSSPAPQTYDLLHPLSARFDPIADVVMAPCWAVMVAFEQPLPTAFDAMLYPSPEISWAARSSQHDDAFHTRTPDPWVLHATPQWSRDHLEDDKDQVIEKLLAALRTASGVKLPELHSVNAHRWRYARTEVPLGKSYLSGMNGRVIAAGDWCLGARVETAWRSGQTAAHALMETLIG
ncbi:NAD(P)/FAD-dependent oxidoreductase [Thalassospira lucentensis]|uniref:NAD(P)/FAD-dependent oxidoreductase n=1 Tax=Thalassospira lucentensis TaxID=168935 RepID=UPI00142E0409|nr:FAD-dependent oxidoreductase [Thalassospira lucentensis]NIZ02068.1 NAD(P)-binding protein [Thalassospira lucentensis]